MSLIRRKPNLKLFIVGEKNNEYAKDLKRLAKKSGHCKDIIFTGKVYDVKKYYSFADLFILPTLNRGRREGCPVALLEAISSNTSVLASRTSGIKDILERFDDVLFEPGNISQLSKKIEEKLFTQKFKRIDIQVLKHIKKNFDIKIEAKKHEDIYKKLLYKKKIMS